MEIVVAAIACYFQSQYSLAFWLVILGIFYGLFGVAKSMINPVWYSQRRTMAGLDASNRMIALIVTKTITTVTLGAFAVRLADLAGYLS
ncbi:hypothetical protein [Bradyrhizobium jicamae]|uniref:hypothetical protein n=1 Tax=Bradyrhizobium jicamae TaxID=280332 RepID=UPI001BA818F8|nr:hypothetical protein [Bradyrhizobium jicamae]MBR0938315.1 hypothetical protein [Bradyrhizobium jicamae]